MTFWSLFPFLLHLPVSKKALKIWSQMRFNSFLTFDTVNSMIYGDCMLKYVVKNIMNLQASTILYQDQLLVQKLISRKAIPSQDD